MRCRASGELKVKERYAAEQIQLNKQGKIINQFQKEGINQKPNSVFKRKEEFIEIVQQTGIGYVKSQVDRRIQLDVRARICITVRRRARK